MKAQISAKRPERPHRGWWLSAIFLPLIFLPSPSVGAAPAASPALAKAGLMLDLDADHGVETRDGWVVKWSNQAPGRARDFVATRDAGRPLVHEDVVSLRGHNALIFQKQELVNPDEDAFDHLTTGSGYTWLAVLCAHRQNPGLKDVNSFFGNLKNSGNYEGFWAGFNDDNTLWIGSRNSTTFGRWNRDNPKLLGPKLETNRFYVVAGRMGAGTGEVKIELFVNDSVPTVALPFPVNPKANASKLAIGQERDAANHPGHESFTGEIARLLIWGRPLTEDELRAALSAMQRHYGIKRETAQRKVWTGQGADAKWSTAANWQPARLPGPEDDVVLDGTSSKTSVWDGAFTIRSLTIAPGYAGRFEWRGHGVIHGNLTVSGKVLIARDPHQFAPVRGAVVDLSALEELVGVEARTDRIHRYHAPLDFGGATEDAVQTLIPPRRPLVLGDLRFLEKGTTRLAGDLTNVLGLEITGERALDLQGHHLAAGTLCASGQLRGLEGATIQLTGFASWSPYGIGSSKNPPQQPKSGRIDLVARQPWKLVVGFKDNFIYSDAKQRGPYTIQHADIANLDASGGEEIIAQGCVDQGGNQNVRFVPKP